MSGSPPPAWGATDLILEFASFSELVAACASKLSEEGMYCETSSPHPIGSQLDFVLRVRDGFSVLRGSAEVVKSEPDDGMALRFVFLDQPSQRLLPRLVDHFRRRQIPLFELPVAETPPSRRIDAPTLTLDDLEAEFLDSRQAPDSLSDAMRERPQTEPQLLDAGDPGLRTEDVEPEPEVLEAPEEIPEEIRFEDLLTEGVPGQIDEEISEEAIPAVEEVEQLRVDSGLSWLPEEPQKKNRRDLWIILLLVLLGALLGAGFYFWLLRDRAEGGMQPTDEQARPPKTVPESLAARVRTASLATVEPSGADLPSPEITDETVAEEATPRPVGAALTGVDRITWDAQGDQTVVTLWADGEFLEEQIDAFRVKGPPRQVVRIRGVRRPFRERAVDVESAQVRRIRTGLHEREGVSELHVVTDLMDNDVRLLRTEAEGPRLRVIFSDSEGG